MSKQQESCMDDTPTVAAVQQWFDSLTDAQKSQLKVWLRDYEGSFILTLCAKIALV